MRTWRAAMADALYGERGFYRRQWPRDHFTTSAGTPVLARALVALAARVDRALGHPERLDVVDVGGGDGALLAGMLRVAPAELVRRLRPVVVEVRPRPAALDPRIGWLDRGAWPGQSGVPARRGARNPDRPGAAPGPVTGLLIAHEWLDNVPVDVVEQTADGPRQVLVDAAGREALGPPPDPADAAWLARWWPLEAPGQRAEVGRPRDEAWAAAVAGVERGLAVAVDYDHLLGRRPFAGTLTGHRAGRIVPPVPDGTCDVTAAVALDACGGLLLRQHQALRALGIDAARPPHALAAAEPARYLTELQRAGEAARLLDPAGLGGFGWLLRGVGLDAGDIIAA